jgi:hypothetical protein
LASRADKDRNDLLLQLDQMMTHDVGRVGHLRESDPAYADLRRSGIDFYSKLTAVKSNFSTDRVFVGQQVTLPQSLTPLPVFTITEK